MVDALCDCACNIKRDIIPITSFYSEEKALDRLTKNQMETKKNIDKPPKNLLPRDTSVNIHTANIPMTEMRRYR